MALMSWLIVMVVVGEYTVYPSGIMHYSRRDPFRMSREVTSQEYMIIRSLPCRSMKVIQR
jgi:hypothetical protein